MFILSEFFFIIICYKFVIGLEKERSVVEFVNRFSFKVDFEIYEIVVKDVIKRFEIVDEVKFGEDFKVIVFVKNEFNERRIVISYFIVILVFYIGKVVCILKEVKNIVVFELGEGNLVKILEIVFIEIFF